MEENDRMETEKKNRKEEHREKSRDMRRTHERNTKDRHIEECKKLQKIGIKME